MPDRRRLVILVVLAAVVAACGVALLIARAGGDGQVAADATTTTASTTTTITTPPTTLRFDAPPPQDLAPAPAPTTTTSTTTTTTAPPSTTTAPPVTAPPSPPRPGPTVETTAGDHDEAALALRVSRRRWAEIERPDGYVYRTQRRCFCPRTDNEIAVGADGAVTGQRTLGGAAEPDPPTVDEIFATIEAAIEADVDRIEVTFDRRDGFPIDVTIDPDESVADDETGRRVSWLQLR